MKKPLIILIAVVSTALFLSLVYYGVMHRRGVPVAIEEAKRPVLAAPYINKEIDLTKGIEKEFWSTLPSREIKLLYQLMILPWPKVITPAVSVKAFHNSDDIYFYMQWKDETQDMAHETDKFSDACAVMFPLDKNTQTPSLMMGFLGKANIWHWKASRNEEFWQKEVIKGKKDYADFHYPFEEEELFVVSKEKIPSAINDLVAIRVGTVTAKEKQIVEGRGFYSGGIWQVVFKRSIKAIDTEQDAAFDAAKRLCAFAVWNGSKGDRGGRKSISDWVELEVK